VESPHTLGDRVAELARRIDDLVEGEVVSRKLVPTTFQCACLPCDASSMRSTSTFCRFSLRVFEAVKPLSAFCSSVSRAPCAGLRLFLVAVVVAMSSTVRAAHAERTGIARQGCR
jgi:hypothetical protein